MKMRKTVIIMVVAALALTMISVQAFAASFTAAQAETMAKQYVPSGTIHYQTENDDNHYEVKFYNKDKQEKYEVKISKLTKKVIAFDSDLLDQRGSATVTLTTAEAQKVVTKELPKAEILSVALDADDGLQEYKVRFKTNTYYGEYTLHPQTGKILERDIQVGTMPAKTDTADLISYEKAIELAKKEVPNGTVTDVDLDREGQTYVYEVELYQNGMEYEVFLDARTGNVLKSNSYKDEWKSSKQPNQVTNPSGQQDIGLEKAKQIALKQVPGAVVKKCHLDWDDGRAIYEGELYKDGWEYEFEIDAVTGNILEWDSDFDD